MVDKQAGKGLAGVCLSFSILGSIAIAVSGFFFYYPEYIFNDNDEFTPLITFGIAWIAFIAASVLFAISFIIGLVHLIRFWRKHAVLKKAGIFGFAISCLFIISVGLKSLPPFMHKKTLPGDGYIAISAGDYHALALKSDGSLIGWGDSGEIPNENDFIAIAAGTAHSVALKSDGSIVCWNNGNYADYGQSNAPYGNDYTTISAGDCSSLALRSNGTLIGWGRTGEVPLANNFVAIAAGDKHSVALKSDGGIVCWISDYMKLSTPEGYDYNAIAAGFGYSLALKSDGSIICWGDFYADDFGNPPKRNDFVAISAGKWHCLALKSDGSIVAWGDNSGGAAYSPAGKNFAAIEAGWDYSMALTSDGHIIVWGDPIFSFND